MQLLHLAKKSFTISRYELASALEYLEYAPNRLHNCLCFLLSTSER